MSDKPSRYVSYDDDFDIAVPGDDDAPIFEFDSETDDAPEHTLPVITRDYSAAKALAELKQWHSFTARGKTHRPFVFEMLRGDPADEITARLAKGETAGVIFDALKSRFDGSRVKVLETTYNGAVKAAIEGSADNFIKSIDSIRSDFEDRFNPVIDSLRDGSLDNRRRAGDIIRQLVRMFGARAYRQGLEDAGVTDEPDDEEQTEIASLLATQSQYVSGFTDALINGTGITDGQAAGRAGMWFNGSISPFYSAGLLAGNKNLMQEWVLGNAEQHCPDCPRLAGQRHRARDWARRGLDGIPRVGQKTTCGGWQCQCKLIPVTGKAMGSW